MGHVPSLNAIGCTGADGSLAKTKIQTSNQPAEGSEFRNRARLSKGVFFHCLHRSRCSISAPHFGINELELNYAESLDWKRKSLHAQRDRKSTRLNSSHG